MERDFYHVNYYCEIQNSKFIVYDEGLISVGNNYLLFYSTITSKSILLNEKPKVYAYIHGIMKNPFYKYDFKKGHLVSRIQSLNKDQISKSIFMIESMLGLDAQIYMSR